MVGPNGEVVIDGAVFLVDAEYAGRAYEVRGTKTRRIRVDGKWLRKTPA